MGKEQIEFVIQFFMMWAVILSMTAVAIRLLRAKKSRGTYGNGLPERRSRPRIVLPDPATIRPRFVAPGQTI